MNKRSKPYNIENKTWMDDSIYVGCSNSMSPPTFTGYQSTSRTKTKYISNNLQTDITTSSTHKITIKKIKHTGIRKKYNTIDDTNSYGTDVTDVPDISQTNSNNSNSYNSSKNKCCILTTVCCTTFIVFLTSVCIIIGIIICIIIKTA